MRIQNWQSLVSEAETRGNGFLQGRIYSNQVAQLYMSVWTQMIEEETKHRTAGFIGDSSVRSEDVETEKEAADELLLG